MFSLSCITYNQIVFCMTEQTYYWFNPFPQYFYVPYDFTQQDYSRNQAEPTLYKELTEKIIIPSGEMINNQKQQKQQNRQENNQNLAMIERKKPQNIRKQRKKRRDQDYKTKAQKKDRNMNSIIIRNFSNYFHKNPQKQAFFSKIATKHKLSITFHEFYRWFKIKMPIGKSYIGLNQFLSLVLSSDVPEISFVSRIIFSKFISLDIFPTIIRSNKIKLTDKIREVKHKTKLIEQINKKLSQLENKKESCMEQQDQQKQIEEGTH